jgi:hypothetical protein
MVRDTTSKLFSLEGETDWYAKPGSRTRPESFTAKRFDSGGIKFSVSSARQHPGRRNFSGLRVHVNEDNAATMTVRPSTVSGWRARYRISPNTIDAQT